MSSCLLYIKFLLRVHLIYVLNDLHISEIKSNFRQIQLIKGIHYHIGTVSDSFVRKWVELPTFRRNMLCPSSESN